MTQQLSYAEVTRMIRDLVNKRGTGTFYVKTDQNRIVMVGVKEGEIVTLASGPKRGEKAIPILRDMGSAAVRVEDSAVAYHSGEMPSTAVILAMLGSGSESRGSDVSSAGPTNADGSIEAERVKTVVCHLLGPHLGPITPLVCEEVVGGITGPLDAQALRLIIERLATEIADPSEALQFVSEAQRQLKV